MRLLFKLLKDYKLGFLNYAKHAKYLESIETDLEAKRILRFSGDIRTYYINNLHI